MQLSKRTAVALLATSALAGSATTAVSALGDDGPGRDHAGKGNPTVLETTVAPSVPGDPAIHGASPGGAPWVLRSSEARLRRDGRLSVRLRGLVIPVAPGNGTPGPVMSVSVSLYCGVAPMAVDTSLPVPISSRGNARIEARLTLPAKCQVPALLIHPNGNGAVYIATSGFGG